MEDAIRTTDDMASADATADAATADHRNRCSTPTFSGLF